MFDINEIAMLHLRSWLQPLMEEMRMSPPVLLTKRAYAMKRPVYG